MPHNLLLCFLLCLTTSCYASCYAFCYALMLCFLLCLTTSCYAFCLDAMLLVMPHNLLLWILLRLDVMLLVMPHNLLLCSLLCLDVMPWCYASQPLVMLHLYNTQHSIAFTTLCTSLHLQLKSFIASTTQKFHCICNSKFSLHSQLKSFIAFTTQKSHCIHSSKVIACVIPDRAALTLLCKAHTEP